MGHLLAPNDATGAGLFADAAPGAPVFDFSADGVRRSLADSLDRLGLDRVDIALIRDPDYHADQAVAASYPTLDRWHAEGTVRAIGVGHEIPLTAAALQSPFGQPAVVSVLTGVRNLTELVANTADLARPIPDDLWVELASGIASISLPWHSFRSIRGRSGSPRTHSNLA